MIPDEGSEVTGVIFLRSAQGFCRIEEGQPAPENPEDPQLPAIPYDHILFIKEGAVEVEISGVAYLCMHQSNIVGAIPD